MSTDEIDTALTRALRQRLSPIYMHIPNSPPLLCVRLLLRHVEQTFTNAWAASIPTAFYSEEGDLPPGHAYVASGPFWSSTQTYSKLLQAVLRRDTRLLSETTWELAMKDDLTGRGLAVPRPRVRSCSI